MRIVALAHSLRGAGGLSVGRNLLHALLQIAPEHEYFITLPQEADYDLPDRSNIRVWRGRTDGLVRRLWCDADIRRQVCRFRPDLVWGLHNAGFRQPPSRQAILLHDAHLLYPVRHFGPTPWSYRLKKRLLRRHLASCLARTDVVFCQTETMRERLKRQFRFPGRVGLCPNAVSRVIRRAGGAPPDALTPYRDRFKFLLVSRYYTHKNFERIVEAYRRHRRELDGTLTVLTIDPSHGWQAKQLLRRIATLGLDRHVVTVGAVPQEDLASYYAACDAVLLPTLLESFSATYLEAMHFGLPIVTSDLDFAREICGDAAVFVDPWDVQRIRDGMIRVVSDRELRHRLVEAGRRRLAGLPRDWLQVVRSALDELGVTHD